jgi:hypothetical protein
MQFLEFWNLKLTQWNKAILGKLTSAVSYGTKRFITVFTKYHHWIISPSSWIKLASSHFLRNRATHKISFRVLPEALDPDLKSQYLTVGEKVKMTIHRFRWRPGWGEIHNNCYNWNRTSVLKRHVRETLLHRKLTTKFHLFENKTVLTDIKASSNTLILRQKLGQLMTHLCGILSSANLLCSW